MSVIISGTRLWGWSYVGAKAQCDGAYSVVVTSSETKHCLQISVIHHAYEVDLVPKAGLEPARLAAGDFESPASTIPPLGPIDFV